MVFKQGKAKVAGHHARRAAEEGHMVLVFRVDMPRDSIEGHPILLACDVSD